MEILEVLNVSQAHVFNAIRGRQVLSQPRENLKGTYKLNPPYHDSIGHNTRKGKKIIKAIFEVIWGRKAERVHQVSPSEQPT